MSDIDTGDTVHHIPSDESWLVAFVEGGKLCACGWPCSLEPLSDFVLVRKAPLAERLKLLNDMASMKSSDPRREYAQRALRAATSSGEAAPAQTGQVHGQSASTDAACRFAVWWNHKRKIFTTPRQAALAAWTEALATPPAAIPAAPMMDERAAFDRIHLTIEGAPGFRTWSKWNEVEKAAAWEAWQARAALAQPAPVQPSAQDAVGAFAIDVEKRLCAKLGIPWSATRISIESLIDQLSAPVQQEAAGEKWFAVLTPSRAEGVLFKDKGDARYAATGKYGSKFGVPTIASEFRDSYGESGKLETIEVAALQPTQGAKDRP